MNLTLECEITTKDEAAEKIEQIIQDCEEVLKAARDIKTAIETGDAKVIRAGLKILDGHTDGYWNRLVLGKGTGEISWLADEIEDAQEGDQ